MNGIRHFTSVGASTQATEPHEWNTVTSGPLSVGTGFYRGTKVGNSLEKAHPLEGLGTYSAWIFHILPPYKVSSG